MTGDFREPPRHRPRRLRRRTDGRLFDLDERRFVDQAELADDIRAGRPFRAQRQGSGTECTNEVLVEVLRCMMSHHAELVAAPDLLGMVGRFLRTPDEGGDRRTRRRP